MLNLTVEGRSPSHLAPTASSSNQGDDHSSVDLGVRQRESGGLSSWDMDSLMMIVLEK